MRQLSEMSDARLVDDALDRSGTAAKSAEPEETLHVVELLDAIARRRAVAEGTCAFEQRRDCRYHCAPTVSSVD